MLSDLHGYSMPAWMVQRKWVAGYWYMELRSQSENLLLSWSLCRWNRSAQDRGITARALGKKHSHRQSHAGWELQMAPQRTERIQGSKIVSKVLLLKPVYWAIWIALPQDFTCIFGIIFFSLLSDLECCRASKGISLGKVSSSFKSNHLKRIHLQHYTSSCVHCKCLWFYIHAFPSM